MTNYSTTHYEIQGDFSTVVAALSTQLNAIVNTKTIRSIGVISKAQNFYGWIVYDA